MRVAVEGDPVAAQSWRSGFAGADHKDLARGWRRKGQAAAGSDLVHGLSDVLYAHEESSAAGIAPQ